MKGGTLFSGIGTPEIACPEIDWRWVAETDPFAASVLRARFPKLKNLGDVEAIDAGTVEPVDVIVFGSPCQSFSVAGRRLGLDDPRGNLALVGLRLIGRIRPRWVVWENVPGVLSSDEGRDFGIFLGSLGELGYGFAYAVLDAQYAGVPQRRRRVFVVGCFDDWQRAAAVLFERESLLWDPPPSREEGQRASRPVASCPEGGSGYRHDADRADDLIPALTHSARGVQRVGESRGQDPVVVHVADPVSANEGRTYSHEGRNNFRLHNVVQIQNATRGKSQNGFGVSEEDAAYTLDGASQHAVALPLLEVGARTGREGHEDRDGMGVGAEGDPMFTLQRGHQHAIAFKASHFTRGKDGAPSEIVPPLSADADKGDQDMLIAGTVSAKWYKGTGGPAGDEAYNLVAFAENTRNEVRTSNIALQLTTGGGKPGQGYPAVAFTERTRSTGRNFEAQEDLAYALTNPGSGGRTHSRQLMDPKMSVRRLLPIETERLQGLPDNWTLITYRGKPAADGPRYRAVGNAMAAPCIRWILQRILAVDEIHRGEGADG